MSVSSRPDNILVVDGDAINGKRYLVFLDLMMPLMTGEELCQKLNPKPQLRVLSQDSVDVRC